MSAVGDRRAGVHLAAKSYLLGLQLKEALLEHEFPISSLRT